MQRHQKSPGVHDEMARREFAALDRIEFIKAPQRSAASDNAAVAALVSEVIGQVRLRGDGAVREYAKSFDRVEIENFEVTAAERAEAVAALAPQTRADTEFAIDNVRSFAEAQLGTILPLEIETRPGLHLGHRVIPIERVGCYVPGGRYPLLSAPIMTIVPAKVAGVNEVIACLPPNAHRAMIAGCQLSGADRIFRIGGAQAIAAMAFGTESVPSVHKIVGPGNAYVNEAKRQVFGTVGIDQLAGPSEIFVVADASGDPEMIATDLLAQAEHDVRTRVGLITTDRALGEATLAEVLRQLDTLSTAPVAGVAWGDYGEIVLCDDEATMIGYADFIAAEHLQVHTSDPHATAKKLRNYGSLFIGENASVVYSDKCCGTNHTLPTMGAGTYTGGLWVGSYVKICTHQWLDEAGVRAVAPPAARQSASETLEGHRRAAQLRLDRLQAGA
jgi:sulfopropanediol 3-dehydrogenase